MDQMIGYRMVVEFGSTHSVPHILYQILLIGSMVLLTVLLFMRKRNGLLSGALAMQAAVPDARNRFGLNRIMQNKRYSVLAAAESFRRMRISAVPAVQSVPQSKEVIIRSKATILNYEDIPVG